MMSVDTPLDEPSAAPPGRAWLSGRRTVALLCVPVAHAGVQLWGLGAARLLPSGWFRADQLPDAAAVTAVILAGALAPVLAELPGRDAASDAPRSLYKEWGQLLFDAAWQALVFLFFVLLSGRLVPLQPAAIALASALVFLTASAALFLLHAAPRAGMAVLVFWMLGLPIAIYFLAELTLIGAGGQSWEQLAQSHAGVQSFVRYALSSAPVTALWGVLHGNLVDGAGVSTPTALLTPLVLTALGCACGKVAIQK